MFAQAEVDPETGALNMKKGEPMINTVTPLLTYLFRSNTDVTSLIVIYRSGDRLEDEKE